jgi:signal peptidase I
MRRARAVVARSLVAMIAVAATAWAATSFTAVYVGGDSMSPALFRGDLAIIRRGSGSARSGDVVLVEKQGWPFGVLHRVLEVSFDGRLRLRGDANPGPDLEPVPRAAVRGIVVLVVPSGRAIAVFEALARVVQSRVT